MACIVFTVQVIDLLLETKSLVAQHLHHHHCAALTAVGVWVAIAKHVHNGYLVAILRLNLHAGKEFLRQPAPTSEALLLDSLYLLGT